MPTGTRATMLLALIAAATLAGCGAVIPSLDDRVAFMHPDLHAEVGK